MSFKNLFSLLVLVGAAVSQSPAVAQYSAGGGLQATGEAVIERKPEIMRLKVDIFAKGSNIADAVAKLKQRREKIQKDLEKMGAKKEAIQFGDVSVDQSQNNRQQQMEMMMMQRMSQRKGAKKPEKPQAPSVRLKTELTAEWTLKGASAEEVLIESKGLEEAVKAADLSGLKDAEEPTAEEAELSEELGEMNMSYSDGNERKPGEPAFLFATRVSPEDYQKASAEAFQDAKTQAGQLAAAAGLTLGPLSSLQSVGAPAVEGMDEYRGYYNQAFAAMYGGGMNGSKSPKEAIGPSPGMLKYKVSVTASFKIDDK